MPKNSSNYNSWRILITFVFDTKKLVKSQFSGFLVCIPEIPALMRAKNDFHQLQSFRLSVGKKTSPWHFKIIPNTMACMTDLTKRTSIEFIWSPLIMALLVVLSMSVIRTIVMANKIRVHLCLDLKSLTNWKRRKKSLQSRSIILGSARMNVTS